MVDVDIEDSFEQSGPTHARRRTLRLRVIACGLGCLLYRTGNDSRVMISLGPVFRAWLNGWGLLLFFGVIVLGMLIPLSLYWHREWLGDRNATTAAALVLMGGFIRRMVIVFSAEGV